MIKFSIYCLFFLSVFIFSCKEQKRKIELNDVNILHDNENKLTEIIIYDVFTPPVASRIYVYSSLASYEAMRFSKEGAASIAEKLNGFGRMPQPEKGKQYNYYRWIWKIIVLSLKCKKI